MPECPLCNGDGRAALPVRNIAGLKLANRSDYSGMVAIRDGLNRTVLWRQAGALGTSASKPSHLCEMGSCGCMKGLD